MGFEVSNNLGSIKTLTLDISQADFVGNNIPLPLKPSKVLFLNAYLILSGGAIPYNMGSASIFGDSSGYGFLRTGAIAGALGLDVLYPFFQLAAQAYTPQTPETYTLNVTYVAGDGTGQLVLAYVEY